MARIIGKVLGVIFGLGCLFICGLLLGSMFGIPTIAAVLVIGGLWYASDRRGK